MTEPLLRIVGELQPVMLAALREILTAEEFATTTVTAYREPPEIRKPGYGVIPPFEDWPRAEDHELIDDDVLLRVHTLTDFTGIWAGGGRETAAELHKRFRSDLQDFVAESSFGWGQWRP